VEEEGKSVMGSPRHPPANPTPLVSLRRKSLIEGKDSPEAFFSLCATIHKSSRSYSPVKGTHPSSSSVGLEAASWVACTKLLHACYEPLHPARMLLNYKLLSVSAERSTARKGFRA
jgi:hypothetical protein